MKPYLCFLKYASKLEIPSNTPSPHLQGFPALFSECSSILFRSEKTMLLDIPELSK